MSSDVAVDVENGRALGREEEVRVLSEQTVAPVLDIMTWLLPEELHLKLPCVCVLYIS